jgi:hypothetical protein
MILNLKALVFNKLEDAQKRYQIIYKKFIKKG